MYLPPGHVLNKVKQLCGLLVAIVGSFFVIILENNVHPVLQIFILLHSGFLSHSCSHSFDLFPTSNGPPVQSTVGPNVWPGSLTGFSSTS